MNINPLTAKDFYKADHRRQYPVGTESVYSNFTPRNLAHLPKMKTDNDEKVVFFGLQYFIKWYLMENFNNNFFNQPKEKVVKQYKRRMDTSLGADAIPLDHIEALHDLGYIPLIIRALPEGVAVPAKTPVFTIKETLPEFYWLTNYLETILSCMIWGPCTSATLARKYKRLLNRAAKETGADMGFVQFQGHDFSMRGMNGYQAACMSGAGHLLSFVGTDTIPAIDFLEDYYNANAEKELVGCSVPATEHSVMTMSGPDGEFETFKRLITELYPKGIVSIVSDSFDFWQVITDFLPRLRPEIMARKGGVPVDKVVIRPDSGDPVEIICGLEIPEYKNDEYNIDLEAVKRQAEYDITDAISTETPHGECGEGERTSYFKYDGKIYKIVVEIEWNRHDKQYYYIDGSRIVSCEEAVLTAEQKGAVECLYEIFGGTLTPLGFKVIDSHAGLIYGDSINLHRAEEIVRRLKNKGFASTNVVLGIGSYTYQYNTRDTMGFAMKATAGVVKGQFREIFKDPKTDSGLKKSAKGLLRVTLEDGLYILKDQCTPEEEAGGELKPVFRDGKLLVDHTLAEIRARVEASL